MVFRLQAVRCGKLGTAGFLSGCAARNSPPAKAGTPCAWSSAFPGNIFHASSEVRAPLDEVLTKANRAPEFPQPARGIFRRGETRQDYFRTVFWFSLAQSHGKPNGYRGKPLWHRCCLEGRRNRNTAFRRNKKTDVMKSKSFLFWSMLTLMSARVVDAAIGEEVQ